MMLATYLRGCGSALKLSFVSYTAGTASVTISSSAQVGDIAVIFNVSYKLFSTPSTVVPSGFTTIRNDSDSTHRWITSYKKLVAGDPGASKNGMNEFSNGMSCIVFRPSRSCSYSFVNTAFQTTNSNPTAHTVSVTSYSTPSIALGWANSGDSSTTFSSGTFDNTYTQNYIATGYKIYQNNGVRADNTIDMNDLGNDNTLETMLLLAV